MFLSIRKWCVCKEKDISLNFIPPSAKRGLNEISKLALSSLNELDIAYSLPMVCSSQFGSWQQILKLAEQFYKEGEFSPAGFSRVPHNTFAGIVSLLTKNKLPYTAIAAGDRTFEMGLVEAITQKNLETIYINAEESTPAVLQKSIKIDGYAFSMLISKNDGEYEFRWTNEKNSPKGVSDFVMFLDEKHNTFTTSNFVITRR